MSVETLDKRAFAAMQLSNSEWITRRGYRAKGATFARTALCAGVGAA
jgi:hypothetical protein